jgi:hypothetical protein
MGFGINLRSDLRRMTDVELAALLARCWERRDTACSRVPQFTLAASYRGLIRHPTAYPFISVLRTGYGITWSIGVAFFYSLESVISPCTRAIMNMHLALCDIADINDELRRRKAKRRFWRFWKLRR